MPLTITNINKLGGSFIVVDEQESVVGYGRAVASKAKPGMVSLYFPPSIVARMMEGIRVPMDWTNKEIYRDG